MEPLTDKEKRILALSLFSAAMRADKIDKDEYFKAIAKAVDMLKIKPEFEAYAKDWIQFASSVERRIDKRISLMIMIAFRLLLFMIINGFTLWLCYYSNAIELNQDILFSLILISSAFWLIFTRAYTFKKKWIKL